MHPEYAPGRGTVSISEKGGEDAAILLNRGFSTPVEVKADNGEPMMIILRGRAVGEKSPRVWEWRLNEEGKGLMDRLPYEDIELELIAAGCDPLRIRLGDVRAASTFQVVFKLNAAIPR
jgi:hypothetical protein